MEIRILNGEDAGEWSRLRLEALQGDPEAFSSSVEQHKTLTLDDIRRRLGSGARDSFVVGAFIENRLVGMSGFVREAGPKVEHKGRIWGVYVAPEQRKQGVARKMFEIILERARTIHGLERILISVAATQTAAKQFYRALGFELFGVEPQALKIGGRYIDEEYMGMGLPRD